jgi:hypothetical protein
MLFFGKMDKSNYDIILIKNVINKLPDKFNYLKRQIDEGIIKKIVINKNLKINNTESFRQIMHNVVLINKYENKKTPEFFIENIIIKQTNSENKYSLTLSVAYEILIGYCVNIDEISKIDLENIDVNNIKIRYLYDKSIEKIFSKDESQYINLTDIYEIKLNKKIYYHIMDLEDGDFIGIDKNKRVYKITHDPHEIKLMKETLIEYMKKNKIMVVRRHFA